MQPHGYHENDSSSVAAARGGDGERGGLCGFDGLAVFAGRYEFDEPGESQWADA
jgi:hypothetical protein